MKILFKDYVIKYTRGALREFILAKQGCGEGFTTRNSKAKLMNYLYSVEAPEKVLNDFRNIWEEYKLL